MLGCDLLTRFTCDVVEYDLTFGNLQERVYMSNRKSIRSMTTQVAGTNVVAVNALSQCWYLIEILNPTRSFNMNFICSMHLTDMQHIPKSHLQATV